MTSEQDTTTTDAPSRALVPGSRWVARSGAHAGREAIIEKVTELSVTMRQISHTGVRGKDTGDKTLRLTREVFERNYVPYSGASNGTTATAWRRVATPKPPPEIAAPVPIARPEGVLSADTAGLAIELLTITPDLASAWLERGGKNRRVRENHVARLAGAMARGEWQVTGDSIKLDDDGTIRDGQHRLHAIVRSGMPIQSLVVRGVSEAAFDVMDSGAKRSAADQLHIHGFGNTTTLEGAARTLLTYERFGVPSADEVEARTFTTTPLIIEYVRQHPEVGEAVHLMQSIRPVLGAGPSIWTAALTVLLRLDEHRARKFAELVASGTDLPRGSAILALRARFLSKQIEKDEFTRTRAARNEHFALVIKAWNAWLKGESVTLLRWRPEGPRPEAFPVPIRPSEVQS